MQDIEDETIQLITISNAFHKTFTNFKKNKSFGNLFPIKTFWVIFGAKNFGFFFNF